MTVADPSLEHVLQNKNWELVDTLWGGTFAMRHAGTKYLPQEPLEPEEAYNIRLKKSVLTNIYKDSVSKVASKPMKRSIVPTNVPPEIEGYFESIDGNNTDLDAFAYEVLKYSVHHGQTHILVDHPEKVAGATLADDRTNGIRPYAVHVKAPQILGFKSAIKGGETVLTQVRIEENSFETDPEDEFAQVLVKRVRVLEPGSYRIYKLDTEADTDDQWLLEKQGTTSLDFIPLITVYTGRQGFMVAEPAMLDMAHLNVAHWQSASDQRNILHVARVPLLFSAGLGSDDDDNTSIAVGPNTMTKGPIGSSMNFVEISGAGIEAGHQDLQDLLEQMHRMGLNMMLRVKTGDRTATARALDQQEADTPLVLLANELESSLELMLGYFAKWLGTDFDGSLEVFKDFSLSSRDQEDLQSLLAMRSGLNLSRRSLLTEMKRRGLLDEEFDIESEIMLLEAEGEDDFDDEDEVETEEVDDDLDSAA